MEIDPHTIQQILTRVREQLRCPQCRKKVNVTLESLKVLGDDFAVMQLKCCVCDAYIMLYATLSSGIVSFTPPQEMLQSGKNVSSTLPVHEVDIGNLREELEKVGGSFIKMFEDEIC